MFDVNFIHQAVAYSYSGVMQALCVIYYVTVRGGGHIGPFRRVILQVLEIKKIYQRIVNNVNLSNFKS